MGQSFFPDNRVLRVAQVCLLAFCIFLCLKPGVDAVRCRKCFSNHPDEPCELSNGKCNGDVCVLGKIFSENGDLMKYYKECGAGVSLEDCGKELTAENREKITCCDTDFCNE
ncbi:Hypothetical predicted protein [Podarcis lilfordi]|uniref:UPAR/Ly6 domain-containing protein n=1 Tax=Podarcis lilfordi TaxID=74358 RepID=A0AA35K031_9SAUR|nr:Hypothetical predicted protein [Podarcis lilfordi]